MKATHTRLATALTLLLASVPSPANAIYGACCVRKPTCIINVDPGACSQWGGAFDQTDQCSFDLPCTADPNCGNGSVDAGEQCDDANTQGFPGDYCGADCVRVACGQPKNPKAAGPLSSDALFILRVAVGSAICDVRVCDVATPDGISTSDALATLKKAVGLDVALRCPS